MRMRIAKKITKKNWWGWGNIIYMFSDNTTQKAITIQLRRFGYVDLGKDAKWLELGVNSKLIVHRNFSKDSEIINYKC